MLYAILFIQSVVIGYTVGWYFLRYRPTMKTYNDVMIYSTEMTQAMSIYKACIDMGDRKNGRIILDESIVNAVESAIKRRMEQTDMVKSVRADAAKNPEKYANV